MTGKQRLIEKITGWIMEEFSPDRRGVAIRWRTLREDMGQDMIQSTLRSELSNVMPDVMAALGERFTCAPLSDQAWRLVRHGGEPKCDEKRTDAAWENALPSNGNPMTGFALFPMNHGRHPLMNWLKREGNKATSYASNVANKVKAAISIGNMTEEDLPKILDLHRVIRTLFKGMTSEELSKVVATAIQDVASELKDQSRGETA